MLDIRTRLPDYQIIAFGYKMPRSVARQKIQFRTYGVAGQAVRLVLFEFPTILFVTGRGAHA